MDAPKKPVYDKFIAGTEADAAVRLAKTFTVDWRSSIADYKGFTVDWRSSTAGYKGFTVDYKSSTVGYKGFIVNYKSSTAGYKGFTVDYKNSIVDYKCFTVDCKSFAVDCKSLTVQIVYRILEEKNMPNSDWLPGRELNLMELCRKWKIGLEKAANVTAFEWKQAAVDAVLSKINGYLTAHEAYEDNDSSKNRLAKDGAKEEAKQAMRDFANTSIRYNKLMSPGDKLVYGIHEADSVATPAGEPESYPEAEADTSVMRQVTIRFWDSATKKRGKPHGVHGAEIRWAILDHEPASENELTNSDFDTASPLTLKFDESQRGKWVYFCLRWESTTNLKGPFGEIYSAVIP